jgi:hypothetical protein
VIRAIRVLQQFPLQLALRFIPQVWYASLQELHIFRNTSAGAAVNTVDARPCDRFTDATSFNTILLAELSDGSTVYRNTTFNSSAGVVELPANPTLARKWEIFSSTA